MLDDLDRIETYRFFVLAVQCPPDNRVWFHNFAGVASATGEPDDMLNVAREILLKTMRQILWTKTECI